MEQTTTTLLIILGSVSGILIIILVMIGVQVWRLMRTLQRIANVFRDESEHIRHIGKKVREKIHKILE